MARPNCSRCLQLSVRRGSPWRFSIDYSVCLRNLAAQMHFCHRAAAWPVRAFGPRTVIVIGGNATGAVPYESLLDTAEPVEDARRHPPAAHGPDVPRPGRPCRGPCHPAEVRTRRGAGRHQEAGGDRSRARVRHAAGGARSPRRSCPIGRRFLAAQRTEECSAIGSRPTKPSTSWTRRRSPPRARSAKPNCEWYPKAVGGMTCSPGPKRCASGDLARREPDVALPDLRHRRETHPRRPHPHPAPRPGLALPTQRFPA
jgi:hypothetical protein